MMRQWAYYIMGPSGAGKDSVISKVTEHFGDEISRPARYITRRLARTDAEQHNVLNATVFDELAAKYCFSLAWEANGYCYGYDKQWLEDLEDGKIVLLNGSRAYWPKARQQYAEKLCPIYLDLSLQSQEKRLNQRGRESQSEIHQRISRNQEHRYLVQDKGIIHLNAEQPLDMVVNDFIVLLLSHQRRK